MGTKFKEKELKAVNYLFRNLFVFKNKFYLQELIILLELILGSYNKYYIAIYKIVLCN